MREESPVTLHQVPFAGLLYSGEVVVAHQWEASWGTRLTGEALFRIVFLGQRQRLSAQQLDDSRIAVCVPGRQQGRQQAAALRELRAVAEARAVYSTVSGPDANALRQALRQQEATLQQRLSQQDASTYALGQVTTLGDLHLVPQEVFQSGDVGQAVEAIVTALLGWAYPALFIDSSSFPRPLTADDVPILYQTLITEQASEVEQGLAASFAPGLRLATPDLPTTLATGECPILDAIAETLAAQGGTLSIDDLLQLLCHSWGLPSWLALLYLLVFVRSRSDSAQLLIREGHGLRFSDGTPLAGDGFTIRDLSWQDDLLSTLQELRLDQELSWAMAMPLAVPLQQHIEQTATPIEEATFSHTLTRLRERLGETGQVLDALAQGAARPASEETSEALRRLTQVSEGERWQEFYRACVTLYERPLDLANDLKRYGHLLELLPQLSDIRNVVEYLTETPLSAGHGELALEREALLAQIQPATLSSTPGLWTSIRQQFSRFVARYGSVYAAHHTAYQNEVSTLATRLEQLRTQVEALDAFNALPELGAPIHSDLPTRFPQLQEQLRLCPLSQEELSLESHPLCSVCDLRLEDRAPRVEAERLITELSAALRQQNRRLGSQAVQRILQGDATLLDKFIHVVQASDLDSLGTVMDDGVIQFLRAFLTTP